MSRDTPPARDLSVHLRGERFCKRRDFHSDPKYRWRPLRRLRTSKARREKRCYDILRDLGVACPTDIRIEEDRNAWGLLNYSEISMDYMADTVDLRYVALLAEYAHLREDRQWRLATIDAVAKLVRTLHAHDFFPLNLHFRNLLVHADGRRPITVYLIDCVSGRFRRWFRRGYYERKDLAFLYMDARGWCSVRERLRFMHQFLDTRKLSQEQRDFCAQIVRYTERKWGDASSSLAD